jgi:hypothetical protein
MTDLKFFTLDMEGKKEIEMTHRGRKMEIVYWNGKQYGHDTVTGVIHWREGAYDKTQSFYVGLYGNEQKPYIAFAVPVGFSKTMVKEVGKKLEDIIIKGE